MVSHAGKEVGIVNSSTVYDIKQIMLRVDANDTIEIPNIGGVSNIIFTLNAETINQLKKGNEVLRGPKSSTGSLKKYRFYLKGFTAAYKEMS
jgi:hypothetical protein